VRHRVDVVLVGRFHFAPEMAGADFAVTTNSGVSDVLTVCQLYGEKVAGVHLAAVGRLAEGVKHRFEPMSVAFLRVTECVQGRRAPLNARSECSQAAYLAIWPNRIDLVDDEQDEPAASDRPAPTTVLGYTPSPLIVVRLKRRRWWLNTLRSSNLASLSYLVHTDSKRWSTASPSQPTATKWPPDAFLRGIPTWSCLQSKLVATAKWGLANSGGRWNLVGRSRWKRCPTTIASSSTT
jgi:hypothetical protein